MIYLDLTRAEVRNAGGRRRVNLGQGYEMVDMQEPACMTRYVYEDSEASYGKDNSANCNPGLILCSHIKSN
jgi:hypothetical protein